MGKRLFCHLTRVYDNSAKYYWYHQVTQCLYIFSMSAYVDELHLVKRNHCHKTPQIHGARRRCHKKIVSKCIKCTFFLSAAPRISTHVPYRMIPAAVCTFKVIYKQGFRHSSEVYGGTRYIGICWLTTTESVGLDG